MTPASHVLVIVPTYNERESLPGALARLAAAVPDADVLVVDDGSPDGTGDLTEQLSETDAAERGRKAIHLMRRSGKLGLGTAYIAGFGWALERGYDAVVEMDADGSHRAEDLPALLARSGDADLVIGSRWVTGGTVVNWPWRREFLSRGANTYCRLAMGVPVKDATAGFRVYRTDLLRKIALAEVDSHGYGFQVDMTWRALKQGARIVEVPITFMEREQGVSKMSSDIILEALVNVTLWGARERSRQVAGAFGRLLGRRSPAAR